MDVYELSFQEAQEIAGSVPESVLIGGWAIWAYNPRLKSRDIDVLIAPAALWRLRQHLRARGFQETSGGHLGKRGFRRIHEDASVDVDVYDQGIGPYRVDELLAKTRLRRLGSTEVRVLEPTELFALKIVAAEDRRGSEKGMKDLADLIALFAAEGRTFAWERIYERIPRRRVQAVLRTAFSDFRTASRLFPMTMEEYRRLKRSFEEAGAV